MGIGLSLISWCAKGTALATLLAVFAGALAAIYVPRGRQGRTRLILWTCVYPFACFMWFLAVFVFQAYVNEAVLYRDPGTGHLYQTPLPNGYAVLLIDEIHDGSVFNPATHFSDASNNDVHPDGTDAVSGVRVLQLAGNKILGGAGPMGQYSSTATRDRVDFYFLLDTDAHTRTNFQTYDDLTKAARASGIEFRGVVLSAPANPDDSTGSNALEIDRVGLGPVLAVFPRASVEARESQEAAAKVWETIKGPL